MEIEQSKQKIKELQQYQKQLLQFQDYAEPFGIWTVFFWGTVIILAILIVYYGGFIYIFQALFATLVFRIISWVGFEYYRCN